LVGGEEDVQQLGEIGQVGRDIPAEIVIDEAKFGDVASSDKYSIPVGRLRIEPARIIGPGGACRGIIEIDQRIVFGGGNLVGHPAGGLSGVAGQEDRQAGEQPAKDQLDGGNSHKAEILPNFSALSTDESPNEELISVSL